jgi:hypothetical protein
MKRAKFFTPLLMASIRDTLRDIFDDFGARYYDYRIYRPTLPCWLFHWLIFQQTSTSPPVYYLKNIRRTVAIRNVCVSVWLLGRCFYVDRLPPIQSTVVKKTMTAGEWLLY